MAKIDPKFCTPECCFCDADYSMVLIWDFGFGPKGVFYCRACGSQYIATLKVYEEEELHERVI